MRSYVINLDRNPERLAAIAGRFASQGLAYERVVAFDARMLSPAEIAEFCRRRPSMPWHHPGQIGCFRSHLAAWRLIAAGSDPYAAVFEDDVHVSDDLGSYLAEAAPPGDADVVRLEPSTARVLLRPAFRRVAEGRPWHGRALRRVRSSTWCTGGYMISRAAAARLAALPEAAHQPVDFMMFCFELSPVARSLRIEQLVPALCVQDRFVHADPGQVRFASEIETGGSGPPEGRMSRLVRNAAPAIWKTVAGYERVRFA